MVAQSVAEILGNHVRLTVEGIDRMYLNLYVPALQSAFGAVSFFRAHRGQPLASSALSAAVIHTKGSNACGGRRNALPLNFARQGGMQPFLSSKVSPHRMFSR